MNDLKLINDNEIIFVDDSKDEIFIAEFYFRLSKIKNPLKTFTSGLEFLEHMEKVEKGEANMPALVLLDIRMPEIDGFTVLKKLRSMEKFRKLPVVVMFSNSDAPSDIEMAYKVGADGYKTKPTGKDKYISFLNSFIN